MRPHGQSVVPRPLLKPGSSQAQGAGPAHLCGTKTQQRVRLGARFAGRSCAAALAPPPASQSGGRGRGATQRGGPSRLLFPEPCPVENGTHSCRRRSTSQNQAASLTRTSDCHRQQLSPAAPRNTPPWARRALPRPQPLPPVLSSEPHPAASGKRCPPPPAMKAWAGGVGARRRGGSLGIPSLLRGGASGSKAQSPHRPIYVSETCTLKPSKPSEGGGLAKCVAVSASRPSRG